MPMLGTAILNRRLFLALFTPSSPLFLISTSSTTSTLQNLADISPGVIIINHYRRYANAFTSFTLILNSVNSFTACNHLLPNPNPPLPLPDCTRIPAIRQWLVEENSSETRQ
ncbi:hypothetical protein DFH27DRAFT_611338 [Peziza echinospora]|nr:hypothetical protein DFH27DRAFT_611338 [Peziza echinospora]